VRTLFTLAYPRLREADRAFIDRFRSEHDAERAAMVAPHFTLLFACSAVQVDTYMQHEEAVAGASPALNFACPEATVGTAERPGMAHVFLVPEEGRESLVLLHARLSGGLLAPYRGLESSFMPHMTIGTLADVTHARALCDDLNQGGRDLRGSIRRLTVAAWEGSGRVADVASFDLTG
jgi:2'-5' RNA ligase